MIGEPVVLGAGHRGPMLDNLRQRAADHQLRPRVPGAVRGATVEGARVLDPASAVAQVEDVAVDLELRQLQLDVVWDTGYGSSPR